MTLTPQQTTASPAANLPLPDTGERVPQVSWPTVALFAGALTAFGLSTWAALTATLPSAVTIVASAAAIFVLFTVLHDASHYSISRHRWVNVTLGRISMLFVSPLISFKSFAFIHIEHHRNTNDGDNDPDHFVSAAPWWQVPFRFAIMDVPYLRFLARNLKSRPRSELIETAALMTLTGVAVITAASTGRLWMLAVVYLIPERIAMFVLAWWFDWLPHHDLKDTQQGNRYRATRNRVGAEWILTPLLLSQNYHLVHHLHPSIPFHRYIAAWRRNENAYLDRDPALITAFGQQLDAGEYREWDRLNGKLARLLPVRAPRTRGVEVTHAVTIRNVVAMTPDSVKVTFAVPAELRERFAFEPGQHLTVHHRIDGHDVRRTYSICSSPESGELAIAIRQVPDGLFSTFAVTQLRAGDTIRLSPPAGSFGTAFTAAAQRNYVAIAAGSGITPIMSVLRAALHVEPLSRFTLIYGNRTPESTMFADEIADLRNEFPERFHIVHVHSQHIADSSSAQGRIDYPLVKRVVGDADSVDRWFLCGPQSLVVTLRDNLVEDGVDPARVHLELFRAERAGGRETAGTDAQVAITLGGISRSVRVSAGETLLEAALRNDIDAPYACLGGACGTCTATITRGEVTMEQNFALSAGEVRAGRVLTCQSRPTTDSVGVDYDA